MKGKISLLVWVVTMVVLLSGCASIREKPSPGLFKSPEDRYVEQCLAKAKTYEEKGDLIEALKNYKIALTVRPSSKEAIKGKNRIEAELHKRAKEHYEAGLKLKKQGKYGPARKEFLMALSLRPDYPEITRILTQRKRIAFKRYIVHKARPGDSLSKLAKLYYGDMEKFPLIARYNGLSDATKIRVGQEIKIPEIEGLPFLVKEKTVSMEPEVPEDIYGWGPLSEERQEWGYLKEQDTEAQIAVYRERGIELYKEKRFQEAISELNKVLGVLPDDPAALEYSFKSCYGIAMALFEKKDYLRARDRFEASLKYKKECEECHAYIRKSEELYKQAHYRKGIQYYDRQELEKAIEEWELVRELDPDYKRVNYYINRARKIKQKLDELRKELKEGKKGT
ncbi:MAG: LysM peptidoglycan-binding domain-containing protein [Deltaproteobacteria bacterium]|nr:LysM peptidoglycan-binding domain-containing protein [Deltaproteobacteria bacterium]MBW1919314.1 LysM peptidoglycan-binding domain-containing protein [Deltaproteobacteria bacterium]MBW1934641.1 LysM peptidoglycan-binding domain-containing protein [Deltaproteobacteria bacterium]MBW1977371.1 LysM peptidoglycan-binding domain-containing protein [Deltaproteobacteria bacterium]MBW2301204.1 LysM peptidoglycan-binding domain-containing protein [Deltaproteobacteria bacterium]